MIGHLLPPAEQVAITWAIQVPELQAIQGDRIGTRLAATLPATRVTRVGNPPVDPWEDDASLQFECWGSTQTDADRLMRTTLAALPSIRFWTAAGGKVHTYEVTSGPYWQPDDPNLSKNARYIFTVDLLITPQGA